MVWQLYCWRRREQRLRSLVSLPNKTCAKMIQRRYLWKFRSWILREQLLTRQNRFWEMRLWMVNNIRSNDLRQYWHLPSFRVCIKRWTWKTLRFLKSCFQQTLTNKLHWFLNKNDQSINNFHFKTHSLKSSTHYVVWVFPRRIFNYTMNGQHFRR